MYNIKSILSGEENRIEIIGQQTGGEYEKRDIPNCLIILNPNKPYYRENLEKLYKMNIVENDCVVIDRNMIKNDDVMDLLIDKANRKKLNLRIIDNDKLTEEEEQKLSHFNLVYSKNVSTKRNIWCATTSENIIIADNIYIKENINEQEIQKLVEFINISSSPEQVYFKFYNPKKSLDIINKMKDQGLRKDCSITIYGYLLEDNPKDFEGILGLANYDIKVTYTTCKDMINKYSKEPFIPGNYYYSELEGGGNTDIFNYYKMIMILEKEERHIKNMDYSPLEAMIYGYNYLKENYVYDENYEITDSENLLYNRSLDFVINRDKMVCEGYSTLYSALMRRCGIPNFRYSSYLHVKNIGRIKDSKYNIDKVCIFDPTNDGCYINNGKRENLYAYKHFAIAPRNTTKYRKEDIMTIPCALSMEFDEFAKYGEEYYSSWDKNFVYDYNPVGFAARMLELMGFKYKEQSIEGFYELVHDLNSSYVLDELDYNTIYKALKTVLIKEGKIKTNNELDLIAKEFKRSIEQREKDYNYNPQIISEEIYINGQKTQKSEIVKLIPEKSKYFQQETNILIEEKNITTPIELSEEKIKYLKDKYKVDKKTILSYLQQILNRLKELGVSEIKEDLVNKCLEICIQFQSPIYLTQSNFTEEKIVDTAISFWMPDYVNNIKSQQK